MKNKNLLYALGGAVGGAALAVVIMLSVNSGSNLKGALSLVPDVRIQSSTPFLIGNCNNLITNLKVDPSSFNPWVGESTYVKFSAKNVDKIIVNIMQNSKVIKQIVAPWGAPSSPAAFNVNWNGTDDNQKNVAPGLYEAFVNYSSGTVCGGTLFAGIVTVKR